MASGKVARRADAGEIAALLDSPEVAALIGRLDLAGDPRGRKGYGARALVGACPVKALYGLPTWTRVASLLADHPGLQDALGAIPSVWACYRFTEKLRANQPALADCLDALAASLQEQMPEIGREIAIDASDMPAFANGQRYVRKGGPERERYSDPDASWGHRSAVSTRAAGSFYGYKLHLAACSRTGLPLAWRVKTARRNESIYVAPLLDALHARGFHPETVAADKGYDHERVHSECEARGAHPIIPLRGPLSKQIVIPLPGPRDRLRPYISRHSEQFRSLYRGRSAVEREFGRLKADHALAPLRVRGLERVRLHADLVILARLAFALNRAQAVPLAA
jgi:DDE family transposase